MTATTALAIACAVLGVLALALLLRVRGLSKALRRTEAESSRNRRLANLDALTGLHNHRYFHETLAREVARAERYGRALALVILDLDDFKTINDEIGHLAGNTVLANAAERLRAVVRSADIAGRVGGDEFAVILPESSASDADQLYHRVQRALAAAPVEQAGRMNLSGGIAELLKGEDSSTFFERADVALYGAKSLGKGRAVWSDANRPPETASSR